RPEAQCIAAGDGNEADHAQPERDIVAPMKTAAIKAGNEPVRNKDKAEEPQRDWWLLTARTQALAREIRIEQEKRRHENSSQDSEIDPEGRNGERTGAAKQRRRRKNKEDGRLDIGTGRHDQSPRWTLDHSVKGR